MKNAFGITLGIVLGAGILFLATVGATALVTLHNFEQSGYSETHRVVDMKHCFVEDHVRMMSRPCWDSDFQEGKNVILVNYGSR